MIYQGTLMILLCALFSLSDASVSPDTINRNATPSENKIGFNDIVTATVTILFLCRPEDSEPALVLGGEYNEFLRRAFFNIVPVTLIAESGSQFNALDNFTLTRYSFIMNQNYQFIRFLRKAHRFVMVASSQPLLRSIIQRTKESPWANPYGFYILVDRQTETRGCINAHSYLWTAWEYDLLSVIFLCIDPDDGIVCYTFNPYSNDTPSSWLEVGRAKGRKGHPWIIFKRAYVDGEEMCTDLDFDKTTTLNGYEIRLSAVEVEPYLKINLDAPDAEKFTGDNSEIIKILLDKLNATVLVEVLENGSIYDLGHVGPNGTFKGMLIAISDGKIDIGMNTRSLFSLWKVRYTYPHMRAGVCIITQPTEEISEFIKLVTFMSVPVIGGILLICLITYVFLAEQQGYGTAALQMVRLIVCVGILRLPKINSTRIFICMTLILLLNCNALLQSHLSSLLTVPVFYRNIATIGDLKRSGYAVYGPESLRYIINNPTIKQRFVAVSYDACKEHVKNSTTAACLENCLHAYYRIKDEDLYKSRPVRSITQAYVTREDWPLFKRVDRIIQRMMQTGMILKTRGLTAIHADRARYRKEEKKKKFKVLLLKQLAFCFYILGIGYTFAITAFLMELVIGRSVSGSQIRNGIVKCKTRRTKETEANDKNRTILPWN